METNTYTLTTVGWSGSDLVFCFLVIPKDKKQGPDPGLTLGALGQDKVDKKAEKLSHTLLVLSVALLGRQTCPMLGRHASRQIADPCT
jgi:hypothetical protein